MNIAKIILLVYISLFIASCREYEVYAFKEVSSPTLHGKIELEITPSRELVGEKKAIESNPYSLLFKYYSPKPFHSFEISEIVIGQLHFKPISSLTASRIPTGFTQNAEYWAIASLSDQLETIELKHQDYEISFLFTLISEEQTSTESFKLKLKPELRKEHKSDTVQGVMGI